jgi:hypothetical protein
MNIILENYLQIKKQHDTQLHKFAKEIERIVKCLCDYFEIENHNDWDWFYYESMFDFRNLRTMPEFTKDGFVYICINKCGMGIGDIDFSSIIPLRFLCMTNSEIVNELKYLQTKSEHESIREFYRIQYE